MLPRGENPRGTCCMIPHFGALTGTTLTATLNAPLPEMTRKIHVDEKHVRWSARVTLPYKPHIGTLSTSPEIDSINSLTPDTHGGNMDLPDMGPGSITYLPVRTPGARLFIGDAHACQGDGEVCGVAVEYPATTTIRVDLIKGWTLEWPRLEREDFIMTIGSARPMEDATRIAYRELVLWMEAEYGFDRWDAYMMLSQCGRVRLGNFVDPKYTVGAGILKKYLAPWTGGGAEAAWHCHWNRRRRSNSRHSTRRRNDEDAAARHGVVSRSGSCGGGHIGLGSRSLDRRAEFSRFFRGLRRTDSGRVSRPRRGRRPARRST